MGSEMCIRDRGGSARRGTSSDKSREPRARKSRDNMRRPASGLHEPGRGIAMCNALRTRGRYCPGESCCGWSPCCRRCFSSGGLPPHDHVSDAETERMLLCVELTCAYVASPVTLL